MYYVLMPVLYITPLGWVVIGFVTGFWFNNAVVFFFTGILVLLIVLIIRHFIILEGRSGSGGLAGFLAVINLMLGLLVLWITTISVNQWWFNILPTGLLR